MNMKDQILQSLCQADGIYIVNEDEDESSPIIMSFPGDTDTLDGNIVFQWTDYDLDTHTAEVQISSAALEKAEIMTDGFHVKDINGVNIVIAPYKLEKLW